MLRIPPMAPIPRTPAANAPAGPESKAVRIDDWGAAVHMVLRAVLASKRAGEAIVFVMCIRGVCASGAALRRDARAGATPHAFSVSDTSDGSPREERAGGTTWASCCPLRW